jgi:hypothetical protein
MSTKITPSLESITIRGKYIIPEVDFNIVRKRLFEQEEIHENWKTFPSLGESVRLLQISHKEELTEAFAETRAGMPMFFSITVIEHLKDSILVQVECRPCIWFKISNLGQEQFTRNQVQEALLECSLFAKQVMSIFKGKEAEPLSVYPIIQRTEIISRLLNLELKEVVKQLDKAEEHIVQNNFAESLKCSRTGFEKMIDWQMKKRGLEKTNNYKNDLERLESKGFLDLEITGLLQTYYKCLSIIAVHEKGEVEPGFYEAQMGYGMTLIMLQYFIDKLP